MTEAPRPAGRPVMHQSWVNLLFAHWRYDPGIVQSLLPEGLEVDTHDGTAWVGLVPFRMRGIRLHGLPEVPGTNEFLEMNVRTYVTRHGEPGVWFMSLDAEHGLAVRVARRFWHLPYYKATMREEREGDRTRYTSNREWPPPRPARARIEWEAGEPLTRSEPGSLPWFLTERYALFARQPDGSIVKGPVHHARWPLRNARLLALESNMLQAAGFPAPQGEPLLHYAEELPVEIWPVVPT